MFLKLIHIKHSPLRLSTLQTNSKLLSHHFSWCNKVVTPAQNIAYIQRVIREQKQGLGAYFAILERVEEEEEVYVGEIAIDTFYRNEPTGNVYYWIAQEHQGKGYAATALLHLKKWAQQHTQLNYLQIRMEADNLGSVAVAQGAGAIYIKTLNNYRLAVGRTSQVLEYHLNL